MHDFILIGSGPAGISAALSARARGLDFLWFGNPALSPKIEKAERIVNYPGLSAVTGREIQQAFLAQIAAQELEILPRRIHTVFPMGNGFMACAQDEAYEAKALILATGVSGTREIPGENRLLGRGVSYCATCDGELYRNKDIAVVCTDPALEEDLVFLAKLARTLYLFCTYETEVSGEHIRRLKKYPSAVLGDSFVKAICCEEEEIPVDALFCLRPCVLPGALLAGLEVKDGHIAVDRMQCTNIPGCFAAGDCTGRPYQYAKAVGEGNVALHSVLRYLAAQK